MGVAGSLILIANPGSASRKYALFADGEELASLHFEYENGRIICTLRKGEELHDVPVDLGELGEAIKHVSSILLQHKAIHKKDDITCIGLRIVAPSSYFLEDREITDEVVDRLKSLAPRAPLHIAATLQELEAIRAAYDDLRVIGVSDSAFHITKPDYAWNYGLPLEEADAHEIKRFGYHGLSVAAVVRTLAAAEKQVGKLIVCHLGSGASVTAVRNGKSLDTTMGYSPLEGLIMSTRSGSIDVTAAWALQSALKLSDTEFYEYLHNNCGLMGLGGSDDTRILIQKETKGDHRAKLALQTYVYSIQKAIGQMTAALGGIDMLVFTGTIGERAAPIRKRVVDSLHYLDLFIDDSTNTACENPLQPVCVSKLAHSKPIFVVSTNEAAEMAARANLKPD